MDFNSPCKDLLFPSGPNLVQKPLYLVGTTLRLKENNLLHVSCGCVFGCVCAGQMKIVHRRR